MAVRLFVLPNSLLVSGVERAGVLHQRLLGDEECARAMGVAAEEQMDLVGDERQRRMQPPQPPLLPVAGDAAGQDSHPETASAKLLTSSRSPQGKSRDGSTSIAASRSMIWWLWTMRPAKTSRG